MRNKLELVRRHRKLWLACLLSVAAFSGNAQAQHISVTGGRPVAKAMEELEDRYRVPITYEDTLYMNDNDFVDVTADVRLDHDGSNPNRVLVPASRTIELALPETEVDMKSYSERLGAALAAAKSVIGSYAGAGGVGGFIVSKDASGLHVVSRSFKDASGQPQILKPALETQISINRRQSAFEMVEYICEQVSLRSGIVVEVGTAPINFLARKAVSVDVKNVTARDLLEIISKQIGMPLTWELFCDPRDGGCALNLDVVQ